MQKTKQTVVPFREKSIFSRKRTTIPLCRQNSDTRLLYYRIDRQSLIEYHEVMWDIPPIIYSEVLHMTAVKDYTVHIDSKKRVTLRGALYQYYNVKEYDNGCIILEPRELTVPESISAATLKDMDNAISNFKKGSVSQPIDLSDF